MDIKEQIIENLKTVVKELYNLEVEPIVEVPKEQSFGDFASNIAMQIVKEVKRNPMMIAEEIVRNFKNELQNQKSNEGTQFIEDITVAAPGFINFKLSKDFFGDLVKQVLELGNNYGKSELLKGENISVEWTDPNPFKEFHIGHVYSNIIGESICRIFENFSADIYRVTYQGDVGMHVAKTIWGIYKLLKEENKSFDDIEHLSLDERIKFLGRAYAAGATEFKDNEESQTQMKEINLLVYIASQERLVKEEGWTPQVDYNSLLKTSNYNKEEIYSIYSKGRKWSLDYFENIYKRLGTKFDKNYFESVAGEYGAKIVKEFKEKGVFEESEGAIVFPGEKYGLHTRVFINSLGLPTYEAKELGLAPAKYKDYKYTRSYIITGNEIDEYFKVLLTALSKTSPELAEKTTHLSHGMVKLPEGKMSSRTGNIIRGSEFIDSVKELVLEKVNENIIDESVGKESVAEKIALAALKYAFLKHSIGEDIVFDYSESISFEGNSGPYLLYTVARSNSILEKGGFSFNRQNHTYTEDAEIAVVRELMQYSDVLIEAKNNLAPHVICNYLYSLSQRFNKFYNSLSVLNAETPEKKQSRLALTAATAQVLKNGLNLLGIETVEKM